MLPFTILKDYCTRLCRLAHDSLAKYDLPEHLVFSLQNPLTGKTKNVGVYSYTADDGTCFIPNAVKVFSS